MAIEKPPKHAGLNLEIVKSYRPPEDQVYLWHTVASGVQENFGTIAARHRIPVDRIIGFNFPGTVVNGRVQTDVVNWYLRHHRGFGGPETRDRLNRMFKGGEKVAIPYAGRVELGEITIGSSKPVNLDEPGYILASQKFVWERKFPKSGPAESGYIAWQASIAFEGEIIQGGLVKTQFKKDQIKAQLEKQLDEDLKLAFSGKFDEKVLKAFAEEIGKGSKAGVMKALASPLEASLKQYHKFGNWTVVPEVGLEGLELIKQPGKLPVPFVFRLAGEYQDTLLVEGLRLQGKFSIKGGVNLGLSKKGWAWVAQKVGGEALKRFLASAGQQFARVAAYLVAEGILAAGGVAVGVVAASVGWTGFVAYMAVQSGREGELRGLAAWYYTAYINKVFRKGRPFGVVAPENGKMRDELIAVGEKDAINTAISMVQKRGEQASYPTEEAALERYREIAIHLYGSESNAELQLTKTLRSHIEKQLGL